MAKPPEGDGASELSSSALPPPSGVTDRQPSWRVPGERTSTVVVGSAGSPSWAEVGAVAARLRHEIAGVADDASAAGAITRALAGLFPHRAVAVRLGIVAPELASSRPLAREENLDRTLTVARAAHDRRDTFGGPSAVFGESPDGLSLPIVAAGEVVGAVALEPVDDSATSLAEANAAVLVLATAASSLRRAADQTLVRHLTTLVTEAPFPAAFVDRGGIVRAVNDLTVRALARPPHELVGVSAEKLAESSRAAQAALERLASGAVVTGIELERRSPNQRIVWVAIPFRDPGGAFAGAIAFGDDRTAVHHLEEQILHAEKLATVGQLTAGIVHELNNPLTSISVYGDYLLRKAERSAGEPADVDRLRRIVEASGRMLRFTRDLVSYARPSSEEPIECALGEVVGQSIGFVEHVLTSANVRVVVDVPLDLPTIRAVRGQLHQVFVNLLTNATQAIVATGRDGGAIRIVGERLGATLRLRLSDDGPGIPGENLDRIFEPFFTTKEAGRGTGLGLSIVRNIIQLHGGTIAVESIHAESGALDTGTTFTITLPI